MSHRGALLDGTIESLKIRSSGETRIFHNCVRCFPVGEDALVDGDDDECDQLESEASVQVVPSELMDVERLVASCQFLRLFGEIPESVIYSCYIGMVGCV